MARPGASPRRYQRTDRLNEVLREVVADALERIGDDEDPRLRLVTITGVDCSSELDVATVYYSSLQDPDDVAAGLGAQRHRLQRAVATEVRARRTPVLRFRPDPAILSGRLVDSLLQEHPPIEGEVPFDPSLYKPEVLADGPGAAADDPAATADDDPSAAADDPGDDDA